MSFTFKKSDIIPDVILIEPSVFSDDRGFFMETYKQSEFNNSGISSKFIQDNCSFSTKNVLRGLHYQKIPAAQAKLVTVTAGEIFDVAVDIRHDSSMYGSWVGEILSETNHRMLYIPRGFAHGFCVLSDSAIVTYKVDNEYSPEHDRGIIWNDPEIGIKWLVDRPCLSEKDLTHPSLADADNNF